MPALSEVYRVDAPLNLDSVRAGRTESGSRVAGKPQSISPATPAVSLAPDAVVISHQARRMLQSSQSDAGRHETALERRGEPPLSQASQERAQPEKAQELPTGRATSAAGKHGAEKKPEGEVLPLGANLFSSPKEQLLSRFFHQPELVPTRTLKPVVPPEKRAFEGASKALLLKRAGLESRTPAASGT